MIKFAWNTYDTSLAAFFTCSGAARLLNSQPLEPELVNTCYSMIQLDYEMRIRSSSSILSLN